MSKIINQEYLESFDDRIKKDGDRYCYTCDITNNKGEIDYMRFYGKKEELRNIHKLIFVIANIF